MQRRTKEPWPKIKKLQGRFCVVCKRKDRLNLKAFQYKPSRWSYRDPEAIVIKDGIVTGGGWRDSEMPVIERFLKTGANKKRSICRFCKASVSKHMHRLFSSHRLPPPPGKSEDCVWMWWFDALHNADRSQENITLSCLDTLNSRLMRETQGRAK